MDVNFSVKVLFLKLLGIRLSVISFIRVSELLVWELIRGSRPMLFKL